MPRLPARSSRARVPGTHAGGFPSGAMGRRQEAPLTQPGRDVGARARPEFLKRRRCFPRPPPSHGRLPTERPHSLSRGRWTPCLFVWSQRPGHGAAPTSSSAPGPTPPPRPAPPHPRASRQPITTAGARHEAREPGSTGHVTWAALVLPRRVWCCGASCCAEELLYAGQSCDSRVLDENPRSQVLDSFFFFHLHLLWYFLLNCV